MPEYRVRAFNSDNDSENRIHADGVAERFGFRGGLVPGVNVYGYLTVPVVQMFGREWLERGSGHVRFLEPVYDGEDLVSRADCAAGQCQVSVTAGKGSVRAVLVGRVESGIAPVFSQYEEAAPPAKEARPAIAAELLAPGVVLGSLRVELAAEQERVLGFIADPMAEYRGADAVAHPTLLLGLINRLLTANFVMPAWIHTQSEIRTWSAALAGESVSVRGRVVERFERKGHEFVVADAAIGGEDGRLCQQVRHTAIYRLRAKD